MPATTDLDLERASRLFRALADETRLRLLEQLRSGEQCVCDLQDEVASSQSLVSFHLRALKDVGLATDRRDGRWVYYSLNLETFEVIRRFVDRLAPSASGLRVVRKCD